MDIEGVVDSIIDIIKAELIAKTDLTADATTGDTTISVFNSFHFHPGQEIVFIDYNYNVEGHEHYQVFEYSVVKRVIDTKTIELTTPVISNWLLSDQAFIQKTIAHSPLYDQNVLYGDREVIPTDEVAITVEPVNISNEWIYLQGGLSEESRVSIFIYGQSVETEEGMRILNKYTKAVYDLLVGSLHLNINDHQAPLTGDINLYDTQFCVCDTPENREYFVVTQPGRHRERYMFQDNLTPRCVMYEITDRNISGGEICLTVSCPFLEEISKAEFGMAIRMNRYFYDSRIDSVTFGVTQKSSAVLRAAELSWFGKEVNLQTFPQPDRKNICFDPDETCNSSSSD
jgi:hypothetical protein